MLCRTSKPGGGEQQDLPVDGVPLYQHVARLAETSWNRNDNCGLLVGATYPSQIRQVRAATPSLPLLIAGVGRQRGAPRDAVSAGATTAGRIIVSASRSITHASTATSTVTTDASRFVTVIDSRNPSSTVRRRITASFALTYADAVPGARKNCAA